MTQHGVARLVAVASVIATTACSDASTSPNESRLSQEEIVALARAFQNQPLRLSATESPGLTRAPIGGSILLAATSAQSPETVDARVDTTAQCAGGKGTIALSARMQGTSDSETRNARLQLDATVTHRECAIQTSSGKIVEVTSTPNLVTQMVFIITNGELADPVTGTTRGSFTWRTVNGHGQCTVDLKGSISPLTTKGRVQGTLCGVTIDEST